MGLATGTRLGAYEVTGSIGAGGMGEVYRARDLKLDREVALKILPSAFAADPDRLARFEREAKTLAALNHPLIAQIYGIEDTTAVRALVMELVDGETLDARIGALSVDETLALATQIAEALHAAHEQGIIHRDLKPANIKVRSDGTIKVLDFGLAKLSLEAGAASGSGGPAGIDGLTQSPTLTLAATQAGIILGTAGYMSPEQAKGRPADKRSDVWSFGCVLYEMLSGRRAFDGEDVSDMLASVLKSEPDWSALPADVPTAIKTLIQRCLVKDRRARVADISVAQFVLAEASALAVQGPPEGKPHADHGPAEAGHYVRLAGLVVAVALIAAAIGAFVAWRFKPAAPEPVSRFAISLPQGQQLSNTGRQLVTLSPDGKQLAYVAADNRLYIRSLTELQPRLIPGSETVGGILLNPVFSPDGTSMAFYSLADGTIKRLSSVGGVSVTICRGESAVYGMTWHDSGVIFSAGFRGIFRCPSGGGAAEKLVAMKENELAQRPELLPDGTSLLFTLAQATDGPERWDKAKVVIESLTTHERKVLIDGGSDARYVPTGHILYSLRGVVFAVPFDSDSKQLTGATVPIIEGVRRSLNATTGVAHFDTSSTGTLVYLPGPVTTTTSDRRIARADRAGMNTPLPPAAAQYVHVRATRDGSRLSVDKDTGNDANVWIYEMNGTTAIRQLTFMGRNRFPIWSPDGQRVAFQSDRDGDLGIFAQRADGTGPIERLTKAAQGESHIPESWSPDGRYISFAVLKETKYALSILSVQGGKIESFGNVVSAEPPSSVFSPDGRWLAYHFAPEQRTASKDGGVYVQPFPATGEIHQAPKVERDFQPVWSRDGSELFYVPLAAGGRIAAVRITTRPSIAFASPETLPAAVIAGRTSAMTRAFDTLPDGKFIGPVSSSDQDLNSGTIQPEIRVVLNWFEELKARVPATR